MEPIWRGCAAKAGLIDKPLTVLANQTCKAQVLRVCAFMWIFRRGPEREAFCHAAKLYPSIRGGHRICRGLGVLNRDEVDIAGTNVEINANRTRNNDLVAPAIESQTRRYDYRGFRPVSHRHAESIDDAKSVQHAVVQPALLQVVSLLRFEARRRQ